jgi:hypothetical protein
MWRATKRKSKEKNGTDLPVLNPNAAGIDILGVLRSMLPYVGTKTRSRSVRFPSFTEDLHRLADWLTACGHGGKWDLLDSAIQILEVG